MSNQIWFGTLIKEVDLNINVNPLIDFIYNLKKELPNNEIGSSIDAWQSPDLSDNIVFNELKENIFNNADDMFELFNINKNKQLVISNMWAGVNPRGGSNTLHNHPGATFSGVFYLKVPEKSGDIVFTHPAVNHNYHFNVHTVSLWNNINSGEKNIPPKVGKLILFPSYQYHYVKPNQSNEDRISIAFNMTLIDINTNTNT